MRAYITNLRDRILQGHDITFSEAERLLAIENENQSIIKVLFDSANELREKFVGDKVDLCTIMNAKSGKCTEDCKFCAQSVHYETNCQVYDLIGYEAILERAMEVQSQGAHRFSLVTSGKGIESEEEFERLLEIYRRLKEDTTLNICASHGVITEAQAIRLKEAGVSMYHHNVETSRAHYEAICTTHTYDDRVSTIENIKKSGMTVCCGGIFGLGESQFDRLKMGFEIKALGIKSVPLNILMPVEGTPCEDSKPLNPVEVLKTMAVYRFINPDCYIRYAGGRMILDDLQSVGFKAGVNGALVGNYLTTIGSGVEEDIEMIQCAGLKI